MDKTSLHIPTSRSLLNTFERVFDESTPEVKELKSSKSGEGSIRLQKAVDMEYYVREGSVSGFKPGAVGSNFDQTI